MLKWWAGISILFIFVISEVIFGKTIKAKVGVGIGSGKIQVDQLLKSGMSYELPSLSIINTGDEGSYYTLNLSYHEKQPELRPLKDWFAFSPKQFFLEPGDGKTVQITLNLPMKIEPGKYFAYIEGMPVRNTNSEAQVGIAAATKLYFEVAPANIFEKIYYKTSAFVTHYKFWVKIVAIILAVICAGFLFNKFFKLEMKKH